MFTILNRLRGTWGIMAKVNGIILGSLFYLYSQDAYTSSALTMMYILGESFGLGKWIWGVHDKKERPAIQQELDDYEGRSNGIHYIANLLNPETKNYYKYCFTALWLRGFYWFALTLLPLVIGGYLPFNDYLVLSILLGYGFPMSVRIGNITEQKFSFKYMDGYWQHAEVWYGAMMDIALAYLLITI